eukprot:CAMPEP_0204375560 /NCGR_PEP_ID=MMETSP0469-20131031/49338_1 /ASSEMBLY_ACC=CAM_ASM_000384 /TAXON_ID=2969 /ORGANISM="Oxyrrhis marina" /LENGTH=64 /DNA_ID=CAMNT_0051366265 /DNA_START=49 /DNA_END=240 /DNA_ORIENTATION=+
MTTPRLEAKLHDVRSIRLGRFDQKLLERKGIGRGGKAVPSELLDKVQAQARFFFECQQSHVQAE